MATKAKLVDYWYVTVDDQPGSALRVLERLKGAKVNLLAYHAFPLGGGRAQVDLAPQKPEGFLKAAAAAGLALSAGKKAILVSGDDKVGAVHDMLAKLAAAGVNMHAGSATAAGSGRFGMILWPKSGELDKAKAALGL
ncbi:MAG: hypothetical protein L0216_05515 [Planctomycetales bacterium]|nr:hypothetical protein [Planctomycetales bacterium]